LESNKNNDNYIDDKPMQKIDPNKHTENIKPIVKLKKILYQKLNLIIILWKNQIIQMIRKSTTQIKMNNKTIK